MSSLEAWLATLDPPALAAVIARRGDRLDHRAASSLAMLAHHLTHPAVIDREIGTLTLAEFQVLSAAGWHARRSPRAKAADGRVALRPLLVSLGADGPGPRRDQALRCIEALSTAGLLWPVDAESLAVAAILLDRRVGDASPASGGVDRMLGTIYNKETIEIIARALGVPETIVGRPELQAAIVAQLTDPDRVRAIVAAAPAEAARLLARVLQDGGQLATRLFLPDRGWQPKFRIDPAHPDQGAGWLARRALIAPVGPGRAAVPLEALAVLRDGEIFDFLPEPPAVESTPVAVERLRGEAQTALTSALVTLTALLDALDQQPVTPRRTGGFPVRDTRRLAKLLGLPERETVFWIGLAHAGGLIAASRESAFDVCPTSFSDTWRGWPAPRRLAHVITTWAALNDVLTWWPFEGERPAASMGEGFEFAAGVRRGTLAALRRLPLGAAVVHATPLIGAPPTPGGALESLRRAVTWLAPIEVAETPDPAEAILHTLYEAELLGVAAHGALTEAGHRLGDEQAIAGMLPPERTTARFQADMTVVVAGTPAPALAGLLDSIGDRESQGHALVYRIKPASVRRALDAGADADELLDRLRAVAEGALPQPLEYLLREAARAHGRVRVAPAACVLRSDDESLITELLSVKGLDLRRIAPTVLVGAKPPQETLAALRAAGYSPALEGETGAAVIERPKGRRSVVRPRAAAKVPDPVKLAARLLSEHAARSAPL